jgi:rhamnulose-1-phosphate aldolase/alcohol dehydrogenase
MEFDVNMTQLMQDLKRRTEAAALPFAVPADRWEETAAHGLTEPELLLYRSNLLGADLSVTNFGGGNTSAKIVEADPLTGVPTTILWVKGSGGDIGSMKLDGFSTLYLDKLLSLEPLYRGPEHEDEMVGYLPHCTFNLNPRAASIDTPLHAYLPYAHVDHVHPDAVIALATSSNGQAATDAIYGGSVGWLDWKRPGFELGLRLRDHVRRHPEQRGVVLAGHGLICWGEDSRSCYENTIELVALAALHLNRRMAERTAFGGAAISARPAKERRAAATTLMPRLRALVCEGRPKLGHFSDDPETLEFVDSRDMPALAALGTSCPDHFLRTKIAPLVLDPVRLSDNAYLAGAVAAYREGYTAYYRRNAGPADPAMRDANPIIVLVPGIGRFAFAADKATARIAAEFYGNAINVMRGATAIGDYLGLPEAEAFAIEYWALEEAKLQRMPKPKPLAGRIALVTGAAGGIGAATAVRLASEGACVMLTDRDEAGLERIRAEIAGRFGKDQVSAATCDVTSEKQIAEAFGDAALAFGGLDILVANAGLASSAPIEETTVELWHRNYDVLAQGYFLAARAAFPLMRLQKGGSIVFIGSKNALAATPNASAYASAKAAALHLARCLALEGAEDGIRVNVVNPDAVIRGSKIWDGKWREERADAYGVDPGEELEDFYRKRSMLKKAVLPEDVAEAVLFLASDASAKSTGNIINVDGGNAQAFTR